MSATRKSAIQSPNRSRPLAVFIMQVSEENAVLCNSFHLVCRYHAIHQRYNLLVGHQYAARRMHSRATYIQGCCHNCEQSLCPLAELYNKTSTLDQNFGIHQDTLCSATFFKNLIIS